MTCQRPGPFHGRCQPTADSSADLGLLARSSGVRPDVVHLHARRALAESQCPEGSRPLVIASGTGGLTPGQVRPDRTGTVPPRRTWEPACRPAGHRGAHPRPRNLHPSDRQNVVYAAAVSVSMPTCWNRVCMPMRRFS